MGITWSNNSSKGCTLNNLKENHKRWCAYGLALNHVVIPAIRPVLDKEILKEYNDLVSSCGIDVQTKHNFPTSKYPTSMNYKNINGNDKKPFDYKVTSHIDFSKLFLVDYMSKLNAFDETCDASAVLTLLQRFPIFSADVQNAAKDVRVDRNAWGHCNFTEWDDSKFRKRFDSMEKLVGEVDPADKSKVVADLNDWKERGVILCMNATIDPELAKTIQERVSKLSSDVEEMAVESKEEMDNLRELDNAIEDIEKRFEKMEQKVEDVQQRVAKLEETSSIGQNKRKDLVIGALCSGMSMDGGDIVFRLASNMARLSKDPSFTGITLGELHDSAEIIDPTVFEIGVNNGFGGDRIDQKVECKHGNILVVVHCFTDERYLAVLADFESERLKEHLLEEFLLIGIEIEGMEIEIINKEEVRKTKEAIKERSKLTTLTENNQSLWCVFGIALNYVVVPAIRPVLEQEILKEYNDLKLNHNIHVQTRHSFLSSKYPAGNAMKYENINGNDTKLKAPHHKNFDYSKFDYKVTSHVDFAKLFLQNYMAKLNAFDETCDTSAVLILLGRIPVFSAALQNAANVVREGRNAWGHCDFTEWDESNFKKSFDDMEKLLREVGFSPADELKVLADLNDWKDKGVALCMNASIDSELVKVMQEHVTKLSSDVNRMAFESREELCNLKEILENTHKNLQNCEKRVENMEQDLRSTAANVSQLKTEQEVLQQELSSTIDKVDQLTIDQEVLQEEQSSTSARLEMHQAAHEAIQQRVTKLEGRQNISYVFSDCTSDIEYFAGRYDPDTRHWFLDDFNKWFSDSDDSRAYVLLGDAAVGKSVMAAVVAQRAKKDGNMAAAYFCRHYDGTRRDPRYLLGTIAYQLCNCNSEYDRVVGGESGIQDKLTNVKLGVHELFTKLLEEPLSKCGRVAKKLVVIDALDEAEYWSREDFLDLIMNRFPMLPKWLVFFITSRPEDSVQFRLKTYNPCIRICAGNSDSAGFYQQHKQDIQRFFEKNVKIKGVPYSAEELTGKCDGMFLYAFYLVEILKNTTQLGSNLFPGNINDFFYKNFKRVYEKVGGDVYRKLFGCALVAPSPLPVSFISFLLGRENSALDKQEVIDAVSHSVAFRTSDKTFAFLHSLIPAWLIDEQKASRMLFIDRCKASKLFKNIVVEFLSEVTQERRDNLSNYEPDLVNYISCFGVRFLINEDSTSSEIVFNALTNYRFLELRIRSNRIGIYYLIEDLEISLGRLTFDQREKKNLEDICFVLKRDKYVVNGCSELLYSCLRNYPELTRADFNPASACWMESGIRISFNAKTVLNSMDCFAFSHDKTLLAVGKQKCLYLCNTRSFDLTLGPFHVMDESISHLTFFPDDKYVFFGRLDRCFSVQEKRVVEMSQFSGNSKNYRWGSFIHEGKYIALTRENFDFQSCWCFLYIFLRWGEHERDLVDAISQTQDNNFDVIKSELLREHEWLCTGFCANFEKLETSVRNRIVVLYADLFEHQIWNVQTGRPVVEEMFSLQLEPFCYVWHFYSKIDRFEEMIGEISLFHFVIYNMYHLYAQNNIWKPLGQLNAKSNGLFRIGIAISNALFRIGVAISNALVLTKLKDEHSVAERPRNEHILRLIQKTSAECYDQISRSTYPFQILSKNGRWLAKYMHKDNNIEIFEKIRGSEISRWKSKDSPRDFFRVLKCAFTNDSNLFVYFERKNLYAISLENCTEFCSISGADPVHFASEDGEGVGYIFLRDDERRIVMLTDLPANYLRPLLPRTRHDITLRGKPVDVSFTSADTMMLLHSGGMCKLWKVEQDMLVSEDKKAQQIITKSLQTISVKGSVFSPNGKLIALIAKSCELLLFRSGKLVYPVFEFSEQCEYTVPCFVFSPDGSLFAFCVQYGSGNQSFYVFDVNTKAMTGPILPPFPFCLIRFDCFCFCSENTKLCFCGISGILVLEYATPERRSNLTFPNYAALDKCGHCTVSSDNKMLACCIANDILIFPLNGQDTFCKVPHNHSGKIEYCKFLRGDRYLISYGIDGVVLLFDLLEWKSIAYRRQESIVRIAISPDEDKLACLYSSGDVNIIRLYGLKTGLPQNFQLPSISRHLQRNSEVQGRQVVRPPDQTHSENDFLINGDDFFLTESSDDDESDKTDLLSDEMANVSNLE